MSSVAVQSKLTWDVTRSGGQLASIIGANSPFSKGSDWGKGRSTTLPAN